MIDFLARKYGFVVAHHPLAQIVARQIGHYCYELSVPRLKNETSLA
jgi:hypothetical protein